MGVPVSACRGSSRPVVLFLALLAGLLLVPTQSSQQRPRNFYIKRPASLGGQRMPCTFEQFHEFQELVDLHKFYFELLITSASFYLGIVGAVLVYVAKVNLRGPRLRLSLAIPIILSFAACVGYTRGYFELQDLATWIRACKTTLKLGWAPHAELLPSLSLLFAAVAAFVSLGLIVILVIPNRLLGKHNGLSS